MITHLQFMFFVDRSFAKILYFSASYLGRSQQVKVVREKPITLISKAYLKFGSEIKRTKNFSKEKRCFLVKIFNRNSTNYFMCHHKLKNKRSFQQIKQDKRFPLSTETLFERPNKSLCFIFLIISFCHFFVKPFWSFLLENSNIILSTRNYSLTVQFKT